ncbi:citrate utilization protein B [Salmonella enterica subsp. enterica]|uniref:Citrate utilization protein B n=1 Tax=Salmonella enterica I TaxID=59201 RepID=A0A447U7L9_SALET|nr:citrate utilization protein B [Salmonella enterica subsp. enterica]
MAQARLETYQQYAQPAAFGALYRRAGITVALALIVGLTLFFITGDGAERVADSSAAGR